jgi:hypothetical protein
MVTIYGEQIRIWKGTFIANLKTNPSGIYLERLIQTTEILRSAGRQAETEMDMQAMD